jgi:hypothetical protein
LGGEGNGCLSGLRDLPVAGPDPTSVDFEQTIEWTIGCSSSKPERALGKRQNNTTGCRERKHGYRHEAASK